MLLSLGRGNFDGKAFPYIGVNTSFSCAFEQVGGDVVTYKAAIDDAQQVAQIEQCGDSRETVDSACNLPRLAQDGLYALLFSSSCFFQRLPGHDNLHTVISEEPGTIIVST